MNLWDLITANSTLPVQVGNTFWDHMQNQQVGSGIACLPVPELVLVSSGDIPEDIVISSGLVTPLVAVSSGPVVPSILPCDTGIVPDTIPDILPDPSAIFPCSFVCVAPPIPPIPAPYPLSVFIQVPDDVLDVCGAMMVMQANITINPNDPRNVAILNDPIFIDTPAYVHVYEWEQVEGPSVTLTLTNGNQTAAFIRVSSVDHRFTFYADRGTAWETSVEFRVTDKVVTLATVNGLAIPTITNRHVSYTTSERLVLGLRATSLNAGEQPAELWWRFNPTSVRAPQREIKSPNTFLRFDLVNSQGTVVSTHNSSLALHTASPPVGDLYTVVAVFRNHKVFSNVVYMAATRNVNSFGKHLYGNMVVAIDTVSPVIANASVFRQVLTSVKKVITDTMVSSINTLRGVSNSVITASFPSIFKGGSTLTSLMNSNIEDLEKNNVALVVVRFNGSNIG